jgi:hypothetical protein
LIGITLGLLNQRIRDVEIAGRVELPSVGSKPP